MTVPAKKTSVRVRAAARAEKHKIRTNCINYSFPAEDSAGTINKKRRSERGRSSSENSRPIELRRSPRAVPPKSKSFLLLAHLRSFGNFLSKPSRARLVTNFADGGGA